MDRYDELLRFEEEDRTVLVKWDNEWRHYVIVLILLDENRSEVRFADKINDAIDHANEMMVS